MKKIIKIIFLCFLITGCTKRMTCTSVNNSEEMDTTEITYIYHTLNKIEKIETTVKYEIKDEIIKKNFDKRFNEIKEKYNDKNIKIEENIEDNLFELKITYNPRKINKDILEKLNSPLKLRQYKKYLETQKMICEEKWNKNI